MDIEIDTLQGFDKNGNKIVILYNPVFNSIEAINELTKVMNSFGETISQFEQNSRLIANIGFSSMDLCLPRPETDQKIEFLNQKDDLEISNQIEENPFIDIDSEKFLNQQTLQDSNLVDF